MRHATDVRRSVSAVGTATHRVSALTGRERELLDLMARGRSNQAICEELCLSMKTVETHVRSVFWKLGLAQDGASHRRVTAVLLYLQALEAARMDSGDLVAA